MQAVLRSTSFFFKCTKLPKKDGSREWGCSYADTSALSPGEIYGCGTGGGWEIDTAKSLDWGYTFVDFVESSMTNGWKVLLIYDVHRVRLSLSILTTL